MDTPADWYPDPDSVGILRFWDGEAWTERRKPAPAPAQSPSGDRVEDMAGVLLLALVFVLIVAAMWGASVYLV